jgi:hypothetical protein
LRRTLEGRVQRPLTGWRSRGTESGIRIGTECAARHRPRPT